MNKKFIKGTAITMLSLTLLALYITPFKEIDSKDISVVFDSHVAEDNTWKLEDCVHMFDSAFGVVTDENTVYAYYGKNTKNNMQIPANKDFTVIELTTPYYIYDYDYHSEVIDGKTILVIDRLGTRLTSSRNDEGYANYLYFDTYYDGYKIA